MADDALKMLESRIDQLIALCGELNQENQRLKAENLNWRRERQELIDNNEAARQRVESMLSRLRSTE
ncbi:TIGR02449 family protein [Chromatocurvus halotolerans]|uniref:Cell division protein ZapB n=1 Tax=Chromatocurvus halotolerans TaxID=1132028 RepID=A0A4V2SBF5_9GAMM|nr:TIGR02449 family protein [Chromatocurvus halotolerans]TCO75340.1 cell division protein ZapB [Chromatocurvus halotolerans]